MYITDDSRTYIGMEIMPFLKDLPKVKQTLITDKDSFQYHVYQIFEVFKHIKSGHRLMIDTSLIEKKQHITIPLEGTKLTPENEFALFLDV
ncbi:MAG: hypothetical protein K2H05_05595 [Duncaniella sp.]|nr:hypothetical protein [Duncaniella sp.]